MSRPVLHVVVVGFHHQRGSEVEFAFPPLLEDEDSHSRRVPDEWKYLPFVALPDGAHNYEQDFTFFHLPGKTGYSTNEKLSSTVFGVSCCRQIDSKDLKIKNNDVTRTTVQKSVCVLCQLPLYGYIQTKLEAATKIYFEERDFSRTFILEELYGNLNASLSSTSPEDPLLFIGLPVLEIVTTFRQRILVLFKLLLLERKVIVHGFPVGSICCQLLSLVSLIPGMVQNGLAKSAHINKTAQYPKDENPKNVKKWESWSPEYSCALNVDTHGLPLAIFTKNSVFHPYLSLQQMPLLKDGDTRSYVVGTSNALYRQQRHLCDVLVDLSGGNIEIHDPELNNQLSLSIADLRFTDYLVQHVSTYVDSEGKDVGWDGSEEWVRAQFKLYLLSLLSTLKHTDGETMRNYNVHFVAAWKKTNNFSVWQTEKHDGIDQVHAGHPFQGQMSLSDVKIRLSNVMQDGMQTTQGKRLGEAVTQTGKAVGGAISGARSFVLSWLSADLVQAPTEDSCEEDKDNHQD